MIRYDSAMLAIGSKKQLLFDNKIIERVQHVTRTVHAPEAQPQPLIQTDKPWEKLAYFALANYQVLRDTDGRWHCWYGTWDFDAKRSAETVNWFDTDYSLFRCCYASSADGIRWQKPGLGLYKEDGLDTNIILGDRETGSVYNVSPIEDPFETDPTKRFKTLLVRCGRNFYHIEAAHSADGIRWRPYDSLPGFGSLGSQLGDMLITGYDTSGRLYTASVRSPHMGAGVLDPASPAVKSFIAPSEPGAWWRFTKRRVWQTESSDFVHWTQPYPVFQPDEMDNVDESYYGMCSTIIGDTYVGFVTLFRECANTMSVRLAYSYDGKSWEWANQRQPWLEPVRMSGNEWDSMMIYLGVPPIAVGDEHWIYYGASKNHHDWWIGGVLEDIDHPEATDMSKIGYYLGLAKMRLDGFVSLDALSPRHGIIVTRPLCSIGNRLVINAKVETGGYIDVEVSDAAGKVLQGFARADCNTFMGDSVRHVVTWSGMADAEFAKHAPSGSYRKGYYKLTFYMRKSSLYSLQFDNDPKED